MSVIYKIVSPTGRIYIGQTTNFVVRFKKYSSFRCKTQVKLYRSLLKHGFENHKITIIEDCKKEDLNIRERYWQDFYNSSSKENLNCFLTGTDVLVRVISEETIKKYSEAQLNSPNSRKGKKHTEESKIKIRLARSRQIITEEHKNKISKGSKSARLIFCTRTGVFYDRMKDAALANGITANYLMCSLIGRNKNNKHLIYA